MKLDYAKFKQSKVARHGEFGFEPDSINPMLFPFQKWVTDKACRKGRYSGFLECGLGKTALELEVAHQVHIKTGKKCLILVPLCVAPQTVREGEKFNIPCVYRRHQSEVGTEPIVVANYEMLEHFNLSEFICVHLDESSVLKAYDGKTKKRILESTSKLPYRYAWSATPAPNDHVELGNHSEFMGAMTVVGMLSRFFVHDSENTSEYRLKGHAEKEFWKWICSWAACVTKPSDIGFSDDGYNLPPLNTFNHVIESDVLPEGQLFHDASPSATEVHRAMRHTIDKRAEMAASLVATNPNAPWVIACESNDESVAATKAIKGAIEVTGSMSVKQKEERIMAFMDGNEQVLVSKPSIVGFGLNMQFCNSTVVMGVSYSFERLYQFLRRFWRFGQANPVNAHFIVPDNAAGILEVLKRKEDDHLRMRDAMVKAMKEIAFNEN